MNICIVSGITLLLGTSLAVFLWYVRHYDETTTDIDQDETHILLYDLKWPVQFWKWLYRHKPVYKWESLPSALKQGSIFLLLTWILYYSGLHWAACWLLLLFGWLQLLCIHSDIKKYTVPDGVVPLSIACLLGLYLVQPNMFPWQQKEPWGWLVGPASAIICLHGAAWASKFLARRRYLLKGVLKYTPGHSLVLYPDADEPKNAKNTVTWTAHELNDYRITCCNISAPNEWVNKQVRFLRGQLVVDGITQNPHAPVIVKCYSLIFNPPTLGAGDLRVAFYLGLLSGTIYGTLVSLMISSIYAAIGHAVSAKWVSAKWDSPLPFTPYLISGFCTHWAGVLIGW